jgi:hypothetical protein
VSPASSGAARWRDTSLDRERCLMVPLCPGIGNRESSWWLRHAAVTHPVFVVGVCALDGTTVANPVASIAKAAQTRTLPLSRCEGVTLAKPPVAAALEGEADDNVTAVTVDLLGEPSGVRPRNAQPPLEAVGRIRTKPRWPILQSIWKVPCIMKKSLTSCSFVNLDSRSL